MKMLLMVTSVYFIFATLCHLASGEFFSALSDMKKLLFTHKTVTESLERYLKLEEERITKLRRLSKMYTDLYKEAGSDNETFLSNPVNGFLLVKQLSSDWNTTVELIKNSSSQDAMNYLFIRKNLFPDEEDLHGAATALMRLQKIYLLNSGAIADGHLEGSEKSPKLTAADCFELGKQAYDVHWSNFSLMWMQEALNRLDKEEVHHIDKAEVMEYIAYSAYEIGNFSLGLNVTQEITRIVPNYTRLYDNLKYYQAKYAEKQYFDKLEEIGNQDPKSKKVIDIGSKQFTEREMITMYERLCRGEDIQVWLDGFGENGKNTQEEKKKLSCYYSTRNQKYFSIGPVKVEVLNLDPKLVLFHDVITEKEMNVIKRIAAPMLERAVVQDTISGKIEATTDRISKSTLLNDFHHKVVARLNKRIEYISGLTVRTSEPIHIINYRIGGHYDPHFDFAQMQAGERIEMFRLLGNRIATWIFYMSDVSAGGSTVFPTIGVAVKPVKGAAGFWYNLKANGEGDIRTLHAACPVLSGTKWVGNKWLHEFENEFRRPCSLDPEV